MTFEVIPVIDLKGGKAVRAVAGNRADYRPLASPLCLDGDPLSAARGYFALHHFRCLYVADLDAIEGGARQDAVLGAIRAAFPAPDLWVDAGFASAQDADRWLPLGLGRPVLGSESLGDRTPAGGGDAIGDAPPASGSPGPILSLDFRGDRFLGSPALLADPSLWPADVIVMCLHDVGTGGGPDIRRLAGVIQRAGGRRVYAAGGVRDRADLQALAGLGVAGALVASALHSGAISGGELAI